MTCGIRGVFNPNTTDKQQKKLEIFCGREEENDKLSSAYVQYGEEFIGSWEGAYSFGICDTEKNILYLVRDRLGVTPLFYAKVGDAVIFSSEIDWILRYPGMRATLDREGLNEVFGLGPAKTSGKAVFQGIEEVLPGHIICCREKGIESLCYWRLQSKEHEENYEQTVEYTRNLLENAVRKNMVSDTPVCAMLSGGVDSSLVAAICNTELKKSGEKLHTFSFDFIGNQENFRPSAFQPSQDRPYVEKMVDFLGSEHHYLECDNETQADLLYTAIDAKGLPSMGDVDSSLLYFSSEISKSHKYVMTGEGADEIFGGYPWFHKRECLEANTFPWTMELEPRKAMLSNEFLEVLHMEEYVRETYEKSISETPKLLGESKEEARRREISYLNHRWFMQTLLDRTNRMSSYAGLTAGVPFADYRIVEYLWNVPWKMKCKDGVVKQLLREAGRGWIPEEVLFRRKSPYPKTYDKKYEELLVKRFREMMCENDAPVMQFLDKNKVELFLQKPSDYGKPWYGQLMAAPQMMAYMLQINYWLKKYNVKIEL